MSILLLATNICYDISLKTTDVELLVALEENSGDHQSEFTKIIH